MKGLLLISGGLDSPVAGYLTKKRNVDLVGIHFSLEPFTDSSPEEKSLEASKILGLKKMYVVKTGKIFEQLANKCNHTFYFVLSKRVMFLIAENIAKKENCNFLVTGENLGQVSSQTLENLQAIDVAVSIPVIRPILTYDKVEVIQLAKKIGTYDVSTGPEMCDVLGPKNPKTKCKFENVIEEEKKLDLINLVENVKYEVVNL